MMDAEKYLREYQRMCNSFTDCNDCPMNIGESKCDYVIQDTPEIAVQIVEEWSKEHHLKTNAEKFNEVFGCKPLADGTDSHKYLCAPRGKRTDTCPFYDCRKCTEWWDSEYKEPKNDKCSKV